MPELDLNAKALGLTDELRLIIRDFCEYINVGSYRETFTFFRNVNRDVFPVEIDFNHAKTL